MIGKSVKSRAGTPRKKEYIVKFYSLKDDSYVCQTRENCLMTLRQAEQYAFIKTSDGLYGVPCKIGE